MTTNQMARAADLLRAGHFAEATAVYRSIVERQPGNAGAWFNLAWLQRRAAAYDDALASYAAALEHGIDRPEEAHVNRAAIFSEHLARTDDAVVELNAALAINPKYFHALFNLANLHEDRGEAELARARYTEASAADPANAATAARLAMLDVHGGQSVRALSVLDEWLAKPCLDGADEAELRFAHARALDRLERFDDAFRSLARANDISGSIIRSHGATYDRAVHEAYVDALIATFPLSLNHVSSLPATAESRTPIFVCGLYRSGSTLTERILSSHSQVTAGGELTVLPTVIAQRVHPYPRALNGMNPDELIDLRRSYFDGVRRLFPRSTYLTDKRTDNFLNIGLIITLMPEAKIVHSIRNVADNLLSLYMLNFDHAINYSFSLDDIAHWIYQYERLMLHWKTQYPGAIHDFDYDALVARPDPVIRNLLAFCGLAFEPETLQSHTGKGVVRTASHLQVREPLHSRASGRAEHYAAHLEAVLRQLR